MNRLVALTSLALFTALPISLPAAPVYPMTAKIVTEKLEAVELPRIRLSGKQDIQMDYYDALEIGKPRNESMLLKHRYLPNQEISLTIFNGSELKGGVSVESVARYLRRMSDEAARNKQYFEVITQPEGGEGPAKIRFLGAKPITIEYALTRDIEGKAVRCIVLESWAQMDGQTYLLRVEAPEDRYQQFFGLSKSLAGSMYFVE